MKNNVYIGNRYVPIFANPVEWDNLREYEPLTIVTYNGTAYTSKRTVPVGTALSDTDYWVVTGNYNAQVEFYRNEVERYHNEVSLLETSLDKTNTSYDIIVDVNGEGDYNTLAGAVSHAVDGNRIFVKSGIYDAEVVNCVGKKLTIVGESKDTVIIRNSYDDYNRPPLNIGKGYIKDITFTSNGTGGSNHSYAVHIDNDDLANASLIFDNCAFNSSSTASVGVGTRNNCVLAFKDCKMTSTGNSNLGALFIHPSGNTTYAGNNQHVIIENCDLISTSNVVLHIQKVGASTNNTYVTAMGTMLETTTNIRTGLIKQSVYNGGEGAVYFTRGAGNNYSILNADTYTSGTVNVGRWNNQVIRQLTVSGTLTANTQTQTPLPQDCELVLEVKGYITNNNTHISFPFGNGTSNTDENYCYFVNQESQRTLYLKSNQNSSYFATVTYLSNDTENF